MGRDVAYSDSEAVTDGVTGSADHGDDLCAPYGTLPVCPADGAESCGSRGPTGVQILSTVEEEEEEEDGTGMGMAKAAVPSGLPTFSVLLII